MDRLFFCLRCTIHNIAIFLRMFGRRVALLFVVWGRAFADAQMFWWSGLWCAGFEACWRLEEGVLRVSHGMFLSLEVPTVSGGSGVVDLLGDVG